MASRLAIFDSASRAGIDKNMFGRDVANFQLFRSIVQHGGFESVEFLMREPLSADMLTASFGADRPGAARITPTALLDHGAAERAGTLLVGGARLEDRAWLRRKVSGDAGYSIVGLIHTIAPHAVRQDIAMASVAPIQPWDAIICTSPAVRQAMTGMFGEWEAYLLERFGGREARRPLLPLIPLGIDGEAFHGIADRADVRAQVRSAMGVGADDVLLIWVGRLSFYEKAFPQPMLLAAELAARETGKRVHFAMAGWFPHANDEARYRAAAARHAPSVDFHIVDGNDLARVNGLWAASDIFISLVDNIQETFGLTPLEAMAAGRPLVVSDWDGYRFTVVHGEQGFLVPTLLGPPDVMPDLAEQHMVALKSYQQYAGLVAQHTAVDVGKAADAIVALIRSPDLRRRMGEAGRRRVRELFDHRVVAPRYAALADELAAIRAGSAEACRRPGRLPVKGDPFADFTGFATDVLDPRTRMFLRPGAGPDDLARGYAIDLDNFGSGWRLSQGQAGQILDFLISHDGVAIGDVLARAPAPSHNRLLLTILWMAKMGIVQWRGPADAAGPE